MKEFVNDNHQRISRVINLLADRESVSSYQSFILSKLSLDPISFRGVITDNMYFPDGIIEVANDEVFVDGGAYDGDTLLAFRQHCNTKSARYFAFEPDDTNFKKLEVKALGCSSQHLDVQAFKMGLWSTNGELGFNESLGESSTVNQQGNILIDTCTIDDMVPDASFIKLDVEGAEYEALKGAMSTIVNNKPKLAICMYHRPEHVVDIPELITSLRSDYTFFFRHHSHLQTDWVLYAV
jgi:FkbM family methyltransferase